MSHEFYRALGEGYPADAALAEARKMVSNRNELEWGTPVLFLRSPDGVLFDVSAVDETSRSRAQVHRLVGAAEDAAGSRDWQQALEHAQAALALDPGSVAAATVVGQAREPDGGEVWVGEAILPPHEVPVGERRLALARVRLTIGQ